MQLKAAQYLYGLKSVYCGSIDYDLCLLFGKLSTKENYEKALSFGETSLSILSYLPAFYGVSKDDIARIENTLSAYCSYINECQKALYYGEASLNTRVELYGNNHLICCNSLRNIAIAYQKMGDFQNAIYYCMRAYDIYSNNNTKDPEFYGTVSELIRLYSQVQEYDKALLKAQELLQLCEGIYSKRSMRYINCLTTLVLCNYYMQNIETAVKYANEAYQLSIDIEGDDAISETTINCMLNLMRLYNYSGQFNKTILLGLKHPLSSERDYDVATTLADAYEKVKDWKNAIKYRSQAASFFKEKSTLYLWEMDKLAVLYLNLGDYLTSKDIYDKLLIIYDSVAIQDSVVYANVLSHIGVTYSFLGNESESMKYIKECNKVRFNLLSSNVDDKSTLYGNYLLSLENLAATMLTNDDDDALAIIDEGVSFYEKNKMWIDNESFYPRLISLRGSYYKNKGVFHKAIDYYDKALQLQINIDSLDYIQTLREFSKTYMLMGDYESAIKIAMNAKAIAESVVGEGHPIYAELLEQLALSNYHVGNYSKSILFMRNVVDISQKTYGYFSKEFARTSNNIATFYHTIGNEQKERLYKKEALRILEHIGQNYGTLYSSLCRDIAPYNNDSTLFYLDKAKDGLLLCGLDKSRTMIDVLRYEADYHMNRKDTIKAEKSLKNAIRIIEEYGGENTKEYADVFKALSYIYKNSDSIMSLKYAENSFKLYQKIYKKNSFAYAEELFEYAIMQFKNNNKPDSILCYLKEASDIMMCNFLNSAFSMPQKETVTYWNRVLSTKFNQWIPLICNSYNTSQSNTLLYNDLLFMKGLILSIDNGTRQSVLASNDDSLINIFKKYSEISASLNSQMTLPPDKIINNIDSLQSLKEETGWILSNIMEKRGYKVNHQYTWENVKDCLNEKDLAIEFGAYVDNEDWYYYALVLNKKASNPKLIRLFDKTTFDSIVKDEKIDSLKLSTIIWKPILNEFVEVNNIYFSPYGILNSYGLEYLPIINEQSGDSLLFYRLSSTKELCNRRDNRDIRNAVLYGDINYNSKETQLEILGELDYSEDYQNLTRSVSMRGDFEPLENSEEEINAISAFLSSKGIICKMYKKNQATEKSLKMLSGKSIGLLHLATHGMYIDRNDVNEKRMSDNLNFIISDEATNTEEGALSRSFLVMSGGNMLIHRDSILYAEDDGILTALEISNLNLNNLNIVVLSACQSALGDITPEGVYGLQRGFKKAGANTILMSLNKVDDEATKILMVEFYRNLMNGKTKQQSLRDAQKHLRQVDNGRFDKPEYWASFIMLDGIN